MMSIVATNINGDSFTEKELREFVGNEKNIGKCDHCPYNDGFSRGLKCGQQNCWIRIHCRK